MTSARLAQTTRDLTREGGALDLGPEPARLLVRMLRLLAAGGAPLTRDQVGEGIADLGIDPHRADELIDAWTERNHGGDIVGLGLTYNPTRHQMGIADATVWAWCAMDTLVFPVTLGQTCTVESTGPATDVAVRLTVGPGAELIDVSPEGAVMTWPLRRSDEVDFGSTAAIWGSFCHHSFFFPSRKDAEAWAVGRTDIEVLPLDEGAAVARELAQALLRYEPRD